MVSFWAKHEVVAVEPAGVCVPSTPGRPALNRCQGTGHRGVCTGEGPQWQLRGQEPPAKEPGWGLPRRDPPPLQHPTAASLRPAAAVPPAPRARRNSGKVSTGLCTLAEDLAAPPPHARSDWPWGKSVSPGGGLFPGCGGAELSEEVQGLLRPALTLWTSGLGGRAAWARRRRRWLEPQFGAP